MPDYNERDDSAKSYEVAIAAKKARGDGHDWEARAAAPNPLVFLLERCRLDYTDEIDLHDKLFNLLDGWRFAVEREVRLSPKERIDFVVGGSIGIEVKIKGDKLAIYRQMVRYAAFDQLKRLILVSSVAIGLPDTINGKPVAVVSLGGAWL